MLKISERIKKVRKEYLKLTQEEFGKSLGVTRSVIKNIELNALKNGIPDNIIKLIAMKFKINEEWLRTGKGEMFDTYSENDALIENLAKEFHLNDFLKHLAKIYLSLTEQQKDAVKAFMDKIYNEPYTSDDEISVTKEVSQNYDDMSVDELLAIHTEYIREVAEVEAAIKARQIEDLPEENQKIYINREAM